MKFSGSGELTKKPQSEWLTEKVKSIKPWGKKDKDTLHKLIKSGLIDLYEYKKPEGSVMQNVYGLYFTLKEHFTQFFFSPWPP